MRRALSIGALVMCCQMLAQNAGWHYRKDDPATKKHILQIDAASFQSIRGGKAKLLYGMSARFYKADGTYTKFISRTALVDEQRGTLSYGPGLKQVAKLAKN